MATTVTLNIEHITTINGARAVRQLAVHCELVDTGKSVKIIGRKVVDNITGEVLTDAKHFPLTSTLIQALHDAALMESST